MHWLGHFLWVAGRAALKKGWRVLISAAKPRDFNALLAQGKRAIAGKWVRLAARNARH
jgi:hypothetical protein